MLLLFIGSGCAALIYEIVWFQVLQLVIEVLERKIDVQRGGVLAHEALRFIPFARCRRLQQSHGLTFYGASRTGHATVAAFRAQHSYELKA